MSYHSDPTSQTEDPQWLRLLQSPVQSGSHWSGFVDGRDSLSRLIESFKIETKSSFVTRSSSGNFSKCCDELCCRVVWTSASTPRLRFSEHNGAVPMPFNSLPSVYCPRLPGKSLFLPHTNLIQSLLKGLRHKRPG